MELLERLLGRGVALQPAPSLQPGKHVASILQMPANTAPSSAHHPGHARVQTSTSASAAAAPVVQGSVNDLIVAMCASRRRACRPFWVRCVESRPEGADLGLLLLVVQLQLLSPLLVDLPNANPWIMPCPATSAFPTC